MKVKKRWNDDVIIPRWLGWLLNIYVGFLILKWGLTAIIKIMEYFL